MWRLGKGQEAQKGNCEFNKETRRGGESVYRREHRESWWSKKVRLSRKAVEEQSSSGTKEWDRQKLVRQTH